MDILEEDDDITKLKKFISVMYFLGFYSSPGTSKVKTNFWSYTWGYFLTILLFSIRAYFLSKFAEIKVMYMTDESEEEEKEERKRQNSMKDFGRQSKVLGIFENEKIQKFTDLSHNMSFDLENYDNIKIGFDDLNNNESYAVHVVSFTSR